MITLKILGGLGNQLSAFACGYSIAKSLKEELVLDVADYYNGYTHSYALDALNIPVCRKLTYTHASEKMLTPDVIPAQLKKTLDIIVDESDGIKTREALMKRINKGQNIYLNGYWGNDDFFSGDEDDIRLMFTPLKKSEGYCLFLDTIRGQCSVAVHMRRTDFVALGNTCSDDYYRAAIAHVQSTYPDAVFYFFSDDIDYAKEHFGNQENFRYIKIFGGMDANLDEFFCISACNHRILHKGSSFSDWASFLNNSPEKIDIIYAPEGSPKPKGFVYLDDEAVRTLNANYNPTPRFDIKNITEAKSFIETLITKGQHGKSLKIINRISLDAYSVKQTDYSDFLEMKAIASVQNDDLPAAEQCLHKQAQYVHDDENFHANCFAVLSALGKKMESAIHAARCASLTQNSELRDKLDQYFMNHPAEHHLYKIVREVPKKHFIIASNSNWFYYIKTSQSIAVLLTKMGHTVSYVNPASVIDIIPGTTLEAIVNASLQKKSSCDSLYSYGFYVYPSFCSKSSGQMVSFVEPLIEHLSRTQPDEAVVLFRNPHAVIANRQRMYAKFIYWDFQDESNSDSERAWVNVWNEGLREHMCRTADRSLIMDREFFTKTQKDWQLKNAVYYQNPVVDDYQYIQERIAYTPNYMADDRTIALAAFILELSNTLRIK